MSPMNRSTRVSLAAAALSLITIACGEDVGDPEGTAGKGDGYLADVFEDFYSCVEPDDQPDCAAACEAALADCDTAERVCVLHQDHAEGQAKGCRVQWSPKEASGAARDLCGNPVAPAAGFFSLVPPHLPGTICFVTNENKWCWAKKPGKSGDACGCEVIERGWLGGQTTRCLPGQLG